MNSKLNLLRGEESNRIFDYRAVVTNPNALSEIENKKQEALQAAVLQAIEMYRDDEEQYNKELDKIAYHFEASLSVPLVYFSWRGVSRCFCSRAVNDDVFHFVRFQVLHVN